MELCFTLEKLWYYGKKTIVLWKKTMVLYRNLWNFDLLWKTMVLWKNYGTMDKNMALYRELWNFDLRRKKHGRLPKTKKLWIIMEKTIKYTKIIEVLNRFIALELWFTIYIYGKTMVLWKKLWHYGKNYGTIPKTMELWFTMEKLWYYRKILWYYSKLFLLGNLVFGSLGAMIPIVKCLPC